MLRAMSRLALLVLLGLTLTIPAAEAAGLPCQPCAGIRLEAPPAGAAAAPPAKPFEVLDFLRSARLAPGSPLFVAWEVRLAPAGATAAAAAGSAAGLASPGSPPAGAGNPALAATVAAARDVAAAGATPWVTLVFTTPPPLAHNLARLQEELSAAAEIAAAAPRGTWFQISWRPEASAATASAGGTGTSGTTARFDAEDYAFLIKRAAVAVGGAQAGMHVATEPLPPDPAAIAALYGGEVAAYLDLVALAPAASPTEPAADQADRRLAAAVEKVHELDPGRPIALDGLPYPAAPAGAALAAAARHSTAGFDLTLFGAAGVDAAALNPLIVLARELVGDLSYDPGSAPTGAAESWAFVRGKDLALRVIAVTPTAPPAPTAANAPPADLVLHFADPDLRRPTLFPYQAGPVAPPSGRVTPPPQAGLEVRVANPAPVVVLGLERLSAAERHGVAEKVTVASARDIPVEEILKRLQVFEDAQSRRLDQYTAANATHLRFQPSAGAESVEVTLTGPFFWSRDGGADWAWEALYINGVRWRGKTLPEIPLIQPEKAAALPLEIHFTKEYRYRLRGTDKLDGRDAWVVDFAPAATGAGGRRLYQGTVWIDRALSSRLRTRAVQIGLEGEVISNEESLFYSPIDAQGRPAAWSADSFILPLRLTAQQVISVLDQPTLVERETLLTGVQLNPPDFAARRQTVEATDVTMVRDTEQGLRYLVKQGNGPRVVKEGYPKSKFFAIGGLFVDDSLSYPLPLAGVNYFSLDFKNTGKQLNVFFAGALLVASASEPRLAGSRFNAGVDLFAIALPFTNNRYSQGKEVVNEELKVRPATFDLKIGRPLGDFVNAGLEYGLFDSVYSKNNNTSSQFVLPSDNLLQSLGANLSFTRFGYTVAGHYSYNMRSSWHAWGLPGNPDFSPADRNFTRYDFTASKNWYLPFFQKLGAELDYYSGSHLDRFSKYEFGFFGGTRIHGYRSNAVRGESATISHLSYGFDFGDFFRLTALGDVAFATDKLDGLHNRLLAGTGIAGSLMGPWQTLVTLDAGVPVAGPDHGFVLYLVFLKLFH
jgi:hypothetical protein